MAVAIESSDIKVELFVPTTDEVPPILLNSTVSFCMNESPTETPVAVPDIEVTTATVFITAFQTLLLPVGIIRLVMPVPSNDKLAVAPVVKEPVILAIKSDCWASPFAEKRPEA